MFVGKKGLHSDIKHYFIHEYMSALGQGQFAIIDGTITSDQHKQGKTKP